MKEGFDILLPFLLQVMEEPAARTWSYELTGWAMNDLHSRSHEKIHTLFRDAPPYGIMKRINREVEALWESPYAYALLVVDDAMKYLRKKGIAVSIAGAWEKSYYAYLMGMLPKAPRETDPAQFMASPLELQVFGDGVQMCREALLMAAWKYKFYVRAHGRQELLLLPPEENEHPDAPRLRILEKA